MASTSTHTMHMHACMVISSGFQQTKTTCSARLDSFLETVENSLPCLFQQRLLIAPWLLAPPPPAKAATVGSYHTLVTSAGAFLILLRMLAVTLGLLDNLPV